MKFVVAENGTNPEKNLPRPRFVHHETHMEGPRRTRDPSGGRRASNRLRHEAAYIHVYTVCMYVCMYACTYGIYVCMSYVRKGVSMCSLMYQLSNV